MPSFTWTDSDGDSAELIAYADTVEGGETAGSAALALIQVPAEEDGEDAQGIVLLGADEGEEIVKWLAAFFKLDLTSISSRMRAEEAE